MIPKLFWYPLSNQDAYELELPQAGRWKWEALTLEWFGFGVQFLARVKK